MRILMITNDTTFAYNLRREVLRRFVAEGHIVALISEVLAFKEELEELGCRVLPVETDRRGTSVFNDLKLFCRYFSILAKEKPDIVLTNNIKPNVYGGLACRLLGIRYMPNITGLGTAVEHPGKMQALTTRLYKWGVAGAECVFFQNSENLEFFRKRNMLSPKSRTCLLPGSGVDLTTYTLLPYPENGEIHFLFAARIMKEKGIDLFLEAARRFHSENVVFDVCGACDDEAYGEKMCEAHDAGIIRYHGQQKYMRPFYEQCSCFLYPSYYPEGMSNVLLEAAATGRPAIAADRSGCRETVTDGVTGYIVPVNDEAATIAAVEKFLLLTWQQCRDMGLAARAKVEKEFDRAIVVEKYMEQIAYKSGSNG